MTENAVDRGRIVASVAVRRDRAFVADLPLFDTEAFSVHGRAPEDGSIRSWARRADDDIAVEATATSCPAGD